MNRFTALLLALVLMATAAACGGSDTPSTIVAPTGTLVTDTFTGTVAVMQTNVHNFTITVGGNVSVTLVSAGPPPTITMGLGIGSPGATAGTCSFFSGGTIATAAGSTAQLNGTAAAGSYCVGVGDIGNALQPIDYVVTVAHT